MIPTLALGVLIGLWAGYQAATARRHHLVGNCWEEMNRRVTVSHGHLTDRDWLDVWERL